LTKFLVLYSPPKIYKKEFTKKLYRKKAAKDVLEQKKKTPKGLLFYNLYIPVKI